MEWIFKCTDGLYLNKIERSRHKTSSDRLRAKIIRGTEQYATGYLHALEFFLSEKLTLEKYNPND